MLTPTYTRQFEKDVRRILRRGKDPERIKDVMQRLVREEPLERRHRDHRLTGIFRDRRDCHVEPDWVLIYKKTATEIIFERTGTHADLFE